MDDRTGVAVVGSINADLAAFGSPLPRPGETVIGTDFSLVLGGKGANQAIAAVRAGAPTYMIGAVGDDLFRDLTLTTLAEEGVDVTAVRVTDGSTGIAHIRVDAALRPERHRDHSEREPPTEPRRCRGLADERCVITFRSSWCSWRFRSRSCSGWPRSAKSSSCDWSWIPAPAQPILRRRLAGCLCGQAERARGGGADRHLGHGSPLGGAGSAMVPRPRRQLSR